MIAGNWKMNTTVGEAVKLAQAMLPGLNDVKGVDKVVCPPFVSLKAVGDVIKGSSVKLGAQNVFYKEKGAFTGEISTEMLAGLCEYVIIGHSERRQYFGDSEEIIDLKIKAAMESMLKPVFCVGESLEENEAGRTEEVLTRQIMASCEKLYFFGGIVIAYEPVWAIGTGKSATSEQADKTIGFIRALIRHRHGKEISDSVRILYGGSVTAANIAELMKMPEIDGALVGGASLKADDFLSIARQASEVRGVS
ncbi:MAG: triose-phosphate isomerase [Dehalococcoidales bacterium]|nr:triose-phosphate isomerase [Dehalococcoidales bacterium]